MERNQIKELLTINRTTFPNFYKAMTETDLTILVNTWHALFKNLDAEVVQNAFAVALAKAEFPVVPANVFAVLNAQSKAKLPRPTNCSIWRIRRHVRFQSFIHVIAGGRIGKTGLDAVRVTRATT